MDFTLFNSLCTIGAFFVTRLKENAVYKILTNLDIPKKSPVLSDRLVRFTGAATDKKCPHILRIVEYYDKKHDRIFYFLTNKMNLGALTIAAIYKDRWAFENFFKALKQNLKIKTFVGTSPNAVKTQIGTALISILLLKYLQLKSTMGWSLSNLSALLRMNLFTYRDLWAWINSPFDTPPIQVETVEQMTLGLA